MSDDNKNNSIFTGEELAELVPVANNVRQGNEPDKQLDDEHMEALVADRIMGRSRHHGGLGNADPTWDRARDLAEVIVDSLPKDLRSEAVATSIEVIPYLQALDGKKIQNRSKGAFPFPGTTRARSINTKRYQESAKVKVEEDAVVDDVNAALPSDGSRPPQGEFDVDASAGAQTAFPVEDMRRLIKEGLYSMEQLAGGETTEQAANPLGYFPVKMGRGTARVGDATISANDALAYLGTLPESDVSGMQLKLAAAGYFDELDNGGFYRDGDAYDENTMLAWQKLLQDSIQNDVAVTTQLGQRSKGYREEARQGRLRQISKFDPKYSRAIADDYGQSVLGRNLSDQEADHLDAQLRALVKQRAGYVAGADNTGIDHALPNATGYDEGDVEQILGNDRQMVIERRQNNLFKTSFALGKL